MVYDDAYEKFSEGAAKGNFADAALRMGNVYLKGIGIEKDPVAAYFYYTQANYASKLRVKEEDFFGNTTVAINIQKALDEARAELPEGFFQEYVGIFRPWIFWKMVEDGHRAEASLEPLDDGNIKITLTRRPVNKREEVEPFLVTIPELRYCELITSMELKGINVKTAVDVVPGLSFRYDYVVWNEVEARLDFYYDDELVFWIVCDEYRIYGPSLEEPSGEKLTLVSVAFQPGGRTYDYLCEIDGVEIGDKVIVLGYQGETEVEVRDVYTRYESELGLPKEKYKKVVRKV